MRVGKVTEDDLRELTNYRASFEEAYHDVLSTIESALSVAPTGRPAKSTRAIVEKLRRESVRLSQMQDVAGLRITVPFIEQQDATVATICALFQRTTTVDRRVSPSHGYRAVHIIVFERGLPVEVQVRSELQHRWAEVSERLADIGDPTLKYGGGDPLHRDILTALAGAVVAIEESQSEADALSVRVRTRYSPDDDLVSAVESARSALRKSAQHLSRFVVSVLALLATLSEKKP